MLDKILHFDLEYINSVRNGELLSRVNGDIVRVRYIVSEMLPELTREIFTIVGLVGYVVYQNPLLAFYTLVILPATFYPLSILAKKMKATSRKAQEKTADLFSRLTEILNNIEVIKANSTEKLESDRFREENFKLFQIVMRTTKIYQFVSPMMETYSSFSITMVIIFGGQAVISGDMSVGSFFAFLTAVGLLFDPIKKVSALFNKMQDGVSATERIIELLAVEQKIFGGEKREIGEIKRVEFQDVSFSFGEKEVLKGISFGVNCGEKLALVGNSGGGKSSVLNLLLRFYERDSGDIFINGEKIENLSFNAIRKEIAFVSQRVYIFNETVLQNIVYGSDEVDLDRVEKALKLSEAYEFVENMKDGIYTELSEFGNNLSGGQRQRIALSRAIYKNASLLIFDEATSALDNRVERKIMENLEEYLKHRIVITVAHRLSTVEDHYLLLFDSGNIVARGNQKELLENSKEFQRLKGE
jgi:subfamily B ATP-binding cassette protein MsbA